jgi:hypothetical protein
MRRVAVVDPLEVPRTSTTPIRRSRATPSAGWVGADGVFVVIRRAEQVFLPPLNRRWSKPRAFAFSIWPRDSGGRGWSRFGRNPGNSHAANVPGLPFGPAPATPAAAQQTPVETAAAWRSTPGLHGGFQDVTRPPKTDTGPHTHRTGGARGTQPVGPQFSLNHNSRVTAADSPATASPTATRRHPLPATGTSARRSAPCRRFAAWGRH